MTMKERYRKMYTEKQELRDDCTDHIIFTESRRGQQARERWARRYDELNGAPESSEDR